jgi:murein DD-endopeptidase MepM/ murein hydrolase activator NlpD
MLVSNPVRGRIRPDAASYPELEEAVARPHGSEIPLVTLDFGPTEIPEEPPMKWPGGETNIFGTALVRKNHEHFHRGIDISTGVCAGDVLAAAPGRVRISHADESGARVVVINHGKIGGHRYETRYAHMKKPPALLVAVGTEVVAGTVIGKIGRSGNATACHLHFAITKDGRPVDPWRRLKQHALIDPDVPVAGSPIVTPPVEVPDVPIPASDKEYLAGQIAVIGNTAEGARVRTGPDRDAEEVRRIPAGVQETWLPTCWVKGELTLGSDRWLTRWNNGQWEFTHAANVRSPAPI